MIPECPSPEKGVTFLHEIDAFPPEAPPELNPRRRIPGHFETTP
jgi:hypothetical protein